MNLDPTNLSTDLSFILNSLLLLLACVYPGINYRSRIETLCLLSDDVEDESGMLFYGMLFGLFLVDQAEELNYTLPMEWISERFSYPSKRRVMTYYKNQVISARFVEWLLAATHPEKPTLPLIEEPDRLLSYLIHFDGISRRQDLIKLFFRKNTYLHKARYKMTPTFAALRNARDFYAWLEILIEFNIDMEAFVMEEFNQVGTTLYDGWTVKTLLCLFKSFEFEIYKPTLVSEYVWSPTEDALRERALCVGNGNTSSRA